MASNGTTLLPGQSAPLASITSTDERGIVLIATSLGLAFSLISLLIRIFIRIDFHQPFARDDVAALASMVFAVLQSSTVFVAVSRGFGETIEDVSSASLIQMEKASYASDILYVITIWLTKCSVAFLFLRLSPQKSHTAVSNAILIGSTVLMVVSVLTVALRCDLMQPWIFIDAQCTGLLARWQAVAAFDIFTETALFGTSIFLVHGLQLSLMKKFVVIVAFGLRLPILIAIAFRLHFLGVEFLSSDPTIHGGVGAYVCTQIQLSYAIVAATTPCLRPFMSALSTNYGAPAQPKKSSPSQSGNEYSLNSISNTSRLGRIAKGKQLSVPTTRWDATEHHASVVSGDQYSIGSHDSKKMIISKNTEWAVEYEGERARSTSGDTPGVAETAHTRQ